MKKLFLFIVLASFAITTFAQRGLVKTMTVDTLQGAETVNFAAVQVSKNFESLVLQALCTQTGGTSDGTLRAQGSIDGTNYVTFANLSQNDWCTMLAKDSSKVANLGNQFTITNGGVFSVIITKGTPFKYFRLQGTGTSGDTTKIAGKYLLR